MSVYRIPKKVQEPTAAPNKQQTRRGIVVAYTTARRADGVVGVCIAVFDTIQRRVVRLCSDTSAAAPFHDIATVKELGLNWEVEFECCSGPHTELPHRNDDIWVHRIEKKSFTLPAKVHQQLAPLAVASFESLWPANLEGGRRRPSIMSGANVHSLAVLRGQIEKFDNDSGLVNLLVVDNNEGSVPLENVKAVSQARSKPTARQYTTGINVPPSACRTAISCKDAFDTGWI